MANFKDEISAMLMAGSDLHGNALALHVILEMMNPTFNKKAHMFGEAQASQVQETLFFLGSQIQCNLDQFSNQVETIGLSGFEALQDAKL